jgi:polyisoprenoid-binding protein YceI
VSANVSSAKRSPVQPGTWKLNPQKSKFGFLAISMPPALGKFTKVEGELEIDADRSLAGSGQIDVASIKSGLPIRDRHLRSSHFFDVAHHPFATFKVSARDADAADLQLEVVLTMKGVTQRAQLTGTLEPIEGENALRLTAKGSLRRRDFGVAWAPDVVMIGNRVSIKIDAVLER